jgi:hypothetical protein
VFGTPFVASNEVLVAMAEEDRPSFGWSNRHTSATAKKRAVAHRPSACRLRALIEVLGFEGLGAQTRFAEEIGVDRRRLNNVLVGYPLSRKLTQIIIRRYPRVSTDFLFRGRRGGHLDRKLEQQLLDYQKRTGISVFTSDTP